MTRGGEENGKNLMKSGNTGSNFILKHTMWKAWDLAVDMALAQLADIVDGEKRAAYESSSFFEEQLTAFEVWLRYGNEDRQPPEQLPIVLQVSGVMPCVIRSQCLHNL